MWAWRSSAVTGKQVIAAAARALPVRRPALQLAPAEGDGLGEWLTGAARYGTPFHVSLHQLARHPIRLRHPVVHICENPAVLRRAAEDLGPAAAPLLCTEGRPSAAFQRLARAIVDGGGELRYHGDFDWPGIAIAEEVMRRHGATPWRMSAADYLTGVRASLTCGVSRIRELENAGHAASQRRVWAACTLADCSQLLRGSCSADLIVDREADA